MNSRTNVYIQSEYRKVRLNRKRKLRRKRYLIFARVALIMIASIVSVIFVTTQFLGKADNPSPPISNEEALQNIITDSVSRPKQSSEKAPNDNIINKYDFSKAVSEREAVENSYFDDAVFIGDSRTEGLILNTGLTNAISYAHKGSMVDTVFTSPVINQNGSKVSVMEALKTTDFKKVYIMLGVNETGWPYNDIFIEKYEKIIDEIKKINPSAIIYVQQILPVTNEVSTTHSYLKNEKISEFNQLISKMAEEKEVYYIDTAIAVALADGSLPNDVATDGIHLNREYCEKWLNYLKTHTVSEKGEF